VPADRRDDHAEGCRLAVQIAAGVLDAGGSALDAVERAVAALEDDPRFNAGTGACLTSDGTLELDASIMCGRTLRAGAVCALPPFRNPIAIGRRVLETARHVLYAGAGAARFAEEAGFVPADPAEMITAAARAKLEAVSSRGDAPVWAGGTVGAVARDRAGNVAAATSTGGMVAKRPGRVGDSPIVGAGTYADNLGGAASATGQGEGILRLALTAQLVSALRSGVPVEAASRAAIARLADRAGATGGVIAVDACGRLGWARSTATMSWAAAWQGEEAVFGA
jgi:beta-aspartyl-peptidase (threonine type)